MTGWTLDSIPWQRFDAARCDPTMLALAKTACLVEYNSHTYGRYLSEVFQGESEVIRATDRWAEEEVQHGQALRRYCELADSRFDFERAFASFAARITLPSAVDGSVRGSRTGEMVARCVVECGTSFYYSSLRDTVQEPVLKAICARIAADEFRHYRLFATLADRCQDRERVGALARLRVLLGRMHESEDDELAYAWHCAHGPDRPYDRRVAQAEYARAVLRVLRRRHLQRCMDMILRIMGLSPRGWLTGGIATCGIRIIRWRMRALQA
jgi:hypothetical protein